ncbi:MAG: hypothetical protein COA78_08855 [Blastopirellula sp.]|nr:MAG: hypothetical protein COA78_08855 [Blastopirellula sp.]
MYFKFKCPHCDRDLKVRQELAGQKRGCPYCQKSLKIPTENPSDADDPASGAGVPDLSNLQTGSVASRGGAKSKSAVQKPVKPQAAPPASAAPSDGHNDGDFVDPSDVGLLTSSIIGICAAVPFMGLMWALNSTYIGNLFVDRVEPFSQGTVIQFMTSFLFFWSIAILVMKSKKIKRQRNYLLMDVLPTDISEEITTKTLDQFVTHIKELPSEHGESFLLNRVRRGLEHFRVRKSASDTVTMMASQSDIDSNNVVSSYAALRVLIWAIPIMGFVGTVLGISLAVASLAGAFSGSEPAAEAPTEQVAAAQDGEPAVQSEKKSQMDALTESLQKLFGGLGTAFNTTLVALVMSMIIKFPMSALQKSEEGVLTWVDEYCNENLLRRLNDGLDGGAERNSDGPVDTKIFKRAVEEAMASQQAELDTWTLKLEKVGITISKEVVNGWDAINVKIRDSQQQLASNLLEQMQTKAAKVREQNDTQQVNISDQLAKMQAVTEQLQQTLSTLAEQAQTSQSQMNESVNGSAERMENYFSGVEKGLTSLSGVLEKLGEESIVVQQVEAPRSGWFSFGGNGKKRRAGSK